VQNAIAVSLQKTLRPRVIPVLFCRNLPAFRKDNEKHPIFFSSKSPLAEYVKQIKNKKLSSYPSLLLLGLQMMLRGLRC
jgi:hypothetical protein